jgi:hypothetical protein
VPGLADVLDATNIAGAFSAITLKRPSNQPKIRLLEVRQLAGRRA